LNPIRTAGSLLGVVTGLWAVYVSRFVAPSPLCSSLCSPPALGDAFHNADPWLGVVGAILVLASLVAIAGVRRSFILGAILSAIMIARVALLWGSYPAADEETTVALSAVAFLVDVVASRPSKALSERDSPLNLPVFG
jgi:uncharacterized membrane protein